MSGSKVVCEVTTGCRHRAYIEVRVAGMGQRYMTNTCRRHATVVISEFLGVSNDIRIREAVRRVPMP